MDRNSNSNKSNNNNNTMISNAINNNLPIINNNSNSNKNVNKSHVNKEKVAEMTTKANHNKTSLTSNHKSSKSSSHSHQRPATQQSTQQQLTRNNNNNNNNANNNRNDIVFDRTPVGSASCSPQFIESYETPSFVRWSQDFHYLIDDPEGVDLFKRYLISEGCDDLLNFWFACQGLKKEDNKEKIKRLIKAIFNKFIVKSKVIQLSEKVRESLMELKSSADSEKFYDVNTFDSAQNEVEEQMKSSIYENFLRSEIYLSYLQSYNNQCMGAVGGYDSPKDSQQMATNLTAIQSTVDTYNTRNQYYDFLPTVHEDSELQTSHQSTNTNNNSSNTIRSQTHQRSQSYPINESHSIMSSKSQTFKNLNQMLNPKSTANSSSRLTTESHPLSPNNNTLYPAYQSYFRSKAMANPPNPYHVKYATILPTSAQDSELQSISSHSTNESMSCVGDSDSGLFSLPHTKKQLQQFNLAIRNNAKINSASNTNSCQINDILPLLHPRSMRQVPPSANCAANPDEFASKLIEKLEKIKKKQESEITNYKKLAEALQECCENPNSKNNSRHMSSSATNSTDNSNCRPKKTLKDVFSKEKFDFGPPEDSDQSIIDKHFAQVFNETPNETPTDPQQLAIGGCVSPPKHNHRLYCDVSKTTGSAGLVSVPTGSHHNSLIDSSVIIVTVKYSTEQVPYKLSLTGPHITFRKFKQHIPAKRGNWQYYFKRKCNEDEAKDLVSDIVLEKITNDNDLLPQIDGKIYAIIESN